MAKERERFQSFIEPFEGKELTRRAFEQQLQGWKKQGKTNDFFMKKYQEEFDKGNDTKADALFDFIQDLPGFSKTSQLIDMLTLKPFERALNQ